jgi:membrane protein
MTGIAATRRRLLDRLRGFGRAAREAADRVVHGESVRLRAMALTYLSIFALVPALVVAFSVVQAITGMDRMAEQVHAFLLDNLAVGARSSLEPYLDQFTRNAHAASAGLVGGALLIWSAISLFSNVDRAINDLWAIRRRRPLRQQAVIYWVGLTVGPLLLATSLVLGHSARAWLAGTGLGFLAGAGSVLLTCAVFSALYAIVPDTRVGPWAALSAGLMAGLAWEVAKWGYASAVARFFSYHAIYGSMAVVPTFMLWLFVSWTIVLYGARVAFVVQNAAALRRGGALTEHPTTREALAGELMVRVTQAFDRGEAALLDEGTLARSLCVSVGELAAVLTALRDAGLVQALAGGGLAPGRDPGRITQLDNRRGVLGRAPVRPGEPVPGTADLVERTLAEVEAEASRRLERVTLRSLCEAPPAAPSGPSGPASPP